MRHGTLDHVRPSNWAIGCAATEADGVTEAWFTFETAVSQGRGQLRLKATKAWTLLTTKVEFKGFEETKGLTRPKGAEHGSYKGRQTWKEGRDE
jgi:putative flavoprotein involved in K+ transport